MKAKESLAEKKLNKASTLEDKNKNSSQAKQKQPKTINNIRAKSDKQTEVDDKFRNVTNNTKIGDFFKKGGN